MSDFSLHGAHQEPRKPVPQRVAGIVHVDVTHAAAAEQLVIVAHVDMRHDGRQRRAPTPEAEAYLARRLQVDVDLAFPFEKEKP
jgi:hypothetical protein